MTDLDRHLGAFLEELPETRSSRWSPITARCSAKAPRRARDDALRTGSPRAVSPSRAGGSRGRGRPPGRASGLVPTLLGRLGMWLRLTRWPGPTCCRPRRRWRGIALASPRPSAPARYAGRCARIARGARALRAPTPRVVLVAGIAGRVVLLERDPLPNGISTYDPIADPVAARGRSLDLAPARRSPRSLRPSPPTSAGCRRNPCARSRPAGGSAWEFAPIRAPISRVSRIDAARRFRCNVRASVCVFAPPRPSRLRMIAFGRRSAVRPRSFGMVDGGRKVHRHSPHPVFFFGAIGDNPSPRPASRDPRALAGLGSLR